MEPNASACVPTLTCPLHKCVVDIPNRDLPKRKPSGLKVSQKVLDVPGLSSDREGCQALFAAHVLNPLANCIRVGLRQLISFCEASYEVKPAGGDRHES